MTASGFVASVATPCVYQHPELGVSAVAHVDDILLVGPKEGLYEARRRMEARYKLKSNFIGPGGGDEKPTGQFLGRAIEWCADGITWSGDQKMIQELLGEWNLSDAKGCRTPGVSEGKKESSSGLEEKERPEMGEVDAKRYRRTAAKLNYASLDDPRIAFASKEASRVMSRPKEGDEAMVKRILRYLRAEPKAVTVPWPIPTVIGLGVS